MWGIAVQSLEIASTVKRVGCAHVPGLLSSEELAGLRNALDGLIAQTDHLPADVIGDFKYGAIVGEDVGVGRALCRIEYSFAKDVRFLMLAAHPRLLQIMCLLYSEPLVVTWEDIVIKTPHSGFQVHYHQDGLWQCQNSHVYSAGVYLDDSMADAFRFLPRSHEGGFHAWEDVQSMAAARESDMMAVPARAGEGTVHCVRAIHGSPANESDVPRRTIYLEYRTVSQVSEDSPWGNDWLRKRVQYIPLAWRMREERGLADDDDREAIDWLLEHRRDWLPDVAVPSLEQAVLRVEHHDTCKEWPNVS